MYSITEIILIQLFCFIIIYNSNLLIFFFNKTFPYFNDIKLKELINFYNFICDNNPLLLDYYDSDNLILDEETNVADNKIEIIKTEEKFEDKYLEKFKNFPNEYYFTELEIENEKKEFEKIKNNFVKNRSDLLTELTSDFYKIKYIIETGNFRNINMDNEKFTDNINEIGKKKLIEYFDLVDEYEDEPDEINFEDLYISILNKKQELIKNINELENTTITDEDMRKQAREIILNKKLDKFIDNYIIESTPIGNIYMRYNNDKKTFEYFSNNSMPYRFLEPVGRKYVMTYWCKPLFVDLEVELKKAEEKYELDKLNKEIEEKKMEEERKNNPKKIQVQLKNYNKDNKDQPIRPMKNRLNKNSILPPQIKANLPNVNSMSDKILLKENANRYTWEGRLTNFCPLKKIDRKILDKKLSMSYADFKKMQLEQQNKK